jgi:hypothetical protein
VDGNLEGNGVLRHGGEVCNGQFKGGRRDGKGTVVYANGNRYVGEWASGDENGGGELTDAAGKVLFQGQWAFGLFVCVYARVCVCVETCCDIY